MPLEESIRLVKNTQLNMAATSSGVRQAKEAHEQLSEDIRLAKGRLNYKKSTRHAEVHLKNAIKALKAGNILRDILMSEIGDALLRAGKEFEENKELYQVMLSEVANDPGIYLLVPVGAGWGATISPQIIFEHAGTLNDYARGINLYRNQLKTRVGGEDSGRGAKATAWWYRNVYGDPKYENTIKQRVSLSGRPAPFWSLIAHGSVSMPSDREDGSYNPLPSRGVDFIEHTQNAIKTAFNGLMSEERIVWEQETREFEKEIKQAETVLGRFESGLEDLTTEFEKNQITLRRFGQDAQYVSEERLAAAAKRLRAGEEFETQRIELTAPGFSRVRRIRPAVERLRGLLEY